MSNTWCDRHWQDVHATMDTTAPLNGILLSSEVVRAYLGRKAEKLGATMPGPRDTHALNQMMANDAPLCCWLGEDALENLKGECVLPEKFRHLPPHEGHPLHVVERGKFGKVNGHA